MAEQLLQYQSPEQFVRVPESSMPTSAETDGWAVKEEVSEPGTHVEKGILSYRMLDSHAKIQAASPTLREIAALYRQSREAEDLMLLSKGLEVVGRHFGKPRDVRNAGVQAFLDSYFETGRITKRAEWLFDIANTRFETRHAVKDQSSRLILTQRLTSEKATEFASNAGRAVRGFLCRQLGIPMVFGTHR